MLTSMRKVKFIQKCEGERSQCLSPLFAFSFQKNLANIRKTMQANDFSSNYSHCKLVNEYQDIGGWGILSANSKVIWRKEKL